MESQNSEIKLATIEHAKNTENHAVSNGLRSSFRELFPLPTNKNTPFYEDDKSMLDLMNAVLEITQNDPKLSQQFDRFVENFQPETPSVDNEPQPTSDTKVNPYAVKNTLLLGVQPGTEWSAFAVQWRRYNNNLLKQALLDDPVAEKQEEEDVLSFLPEKDMDMFGYSPLDDELQLVRCNFCNKPLRTSRFAQHLGIINHITNSPPAQCPAKNRADSKQPLSDVLVRNDMYQNTEVNGVDTKDDIEAKPVLAKRKITDTSFKIPKKNPTVDQPQAPEAPVQKSSKSSKKIKGSPPSNGEATLSIAAPKPVPVESPVKAKKKSADSTKSEKGEKKTVKKAVPDNNTKSNPMLMFNNMLSMQNYAAYQQQMANIQAQQQANGNIQASSVNTPNRTYVNNNIKYLPQQMPMQHYVNNNNTTTPQYVNMSLINNYQTNPMLASQMLQNQQLQAHLQNQQLHNQQYAMLAANPNSPVLKKPSNKKPRKKGENESSDSPSTTPTAQPSQGIIYVTQQQQNQLQQQMYANQMQLFMQRQQQLQLLASKGMLPNTIPNTINMNNMNINQSNNGMPTMNNATMGGVNPNMVSMGMNHMSMNQPNTAINNTNMAMNSSHVPNMPNNMNMPATAINNMSVNNTNMATINPMMVTNTMNLQQQQQQQPNTAAASSGTPSNMQQRPAPQKATMAPQGTHTHVQQTQTQTINMTPQQYQQITQQQLQQLHLLQQQQMLQNMNAAQQGKGQVARPQGQTPTKMTAITPNAQMMTPNGNILVSPMNQVPKGTPMYNIKPNNNNGAAPKAATTPTQKPAVPSKAIQGSNSAVTGKAGTLQSNPPDTGTKHPGWHSFVIKNNNNNNTQQPQAPVNTTPNNQPYPTMPPRATVVQMPPPLPQYPLTPTTAQAVTGIAVMLPESQTP